MNIELKISLSDVPLLAAALRYEVARHQRNAKRARVSAHWKRNPQNTYRSELEAGALDTKAATFELHAERCEELLKVLP